MTDHSRRDLLKLGAAATTATLIPFSGLNAREADRSRSPEWHPNERAVSHAVVDNATAAFAVLLQAGIAASAEDLRVGAYAARTLFSHLDETGYLRERENRVAASARSERPTAADLANIHAQMKARGLDVSAEVLARAFDISDERRAEAIGDIRREGLRAVLMASVSGLDRAADKAASSSASNIGRLGEPRSDDILDDWCRGMQMLIDGILVVAFIDFLVCEAGVWPGCVIAAALAGYAALLTLAKDYIC